jgi:3-oxoacyl-[acyl-carrier-protein] synthase II
MDEYFRHVHERGLDGIRPFGYLQCMPHTCATNLAMLLGARGRIIAPCSACTSGSQSIGYAAEAIRAGVETVMVAGGAEELDYSAAAVFDILFATSVKYHDEPTRTPRPFDEGRDGLVVAEGAGTLILEEYEHARARGARIWAELVGFGTNCDGRHLTNPSPEGMEGAMRQSLADAGLALTEIGYVNAHATATEVGDIAEAAASRAVFGDRVPISSTKGFTGHTLGGCGAIESAFAIWAMHWGVLPPTLNLDVLDPRCAGVDHIQEPRDQTVAVVMNNNFAFGGINTSLIFRRIQD